MPSRVVSGPTRQREPIRVPPSNWVPGAITVSHLRFGPQPIESTYLIGQADFVACHQFEFMEKLDVLELARPGGTFLLNSPWGPEEVWGKLPREAQQAILDRKLKFYVVDALAVALFAAPGRGSIRVSFSAATSLRALR